MPTFQRRCRECQKLKALSKLNRFRICDSCAEDWALRVLRKRILRDALNAAYEQLVEDRQHTILACDICGAEPKTRRLNVDHDHFTQNVRGLLCFRCNYVLGWFNDSPERFENAASYLNKTVKYKLDLQTGGVFALPQELNNHTE